MLTVDDIHVSYGRMTALQGLSLEVKQGEFISMIGPNGAGKSTVLKAISGLVSPSAGEIYLDGMPLHGRAPEDIVRKGISLVPEGRHIFSTLTVEENLLLGAATRRKEPQIEEDIDRATERFPVLRKRLHSTASKLSGGEQQQLAIARALLSRPRLLLLDEPSLGLAPLVLEEVFAVLEALRREGLTIILVEQNAVMAVQTADRTYVLKNGKVDVTGTRDELLDMEDIRRAYFGFGGQVAFTAEAFKPEGEAR